MILPTAKLPLQRSRPTAYRVLKCLPHQQDPQCRSRSSDLAGNTRCVGVKLIPEGSPEVALNQKVKNLIQKLGEAIHESVSESEDIAVVVKNIREQGFDVLLMLEATIGLNEVAEDSADALDSDLMEADDSSQPFTSNDMNFLKSLRISLSEDSESPIDPGA